MNGILKTVLSLSLSGSLFILLLLLCKPLFRNRTSKRWQYYIWLVVMARLLLPFAPEASPVGALFREIDHVIVQTDAGAAPGQTIVSVPQPGKNAAVKNDTAAQSGAAPTDIAPPPQPIFTGFVQNLWLIWLVVALILLIRKITIYQGFVKYIKAGRAEVSDTAMLDRLAQIGAQAGVNRPVELYTNDLISSPLLIGFFRPCIVLPTADRTPVDLEYIMLHELTHYRRRDMFYKWLVQFCVCVHWFNPLVFLMSREIGRACELSCDEAVIRTLDPQGRRAYGDTLLNAMGMGGNYKESLACVTLNESKERLKERLDAIMKFKKTSRLTAAISVMLLFALCLGATAAGAYTAPKQQSNGDRTSAELQGSNPNQTSITVPVDIQTVKNGDFVWLGEFRLSYGDKLYYAVSAEKGNGLKTGFAAQNDDPFNRTYFTISNKREDGTLETRGNFTFEAPVEPGRYNLFIQATDGDLMNVTGSITIETTQPPTSTIENVNVNFNGITFTGRGPVGVELVKAQSANVTFELLNMDNEESCTTKAELVDGAMQITVNNDAPNGVNVNFGPDYQNVVRVRIPDAVYTKFEIQSQEMVVQMQDFNAPVHVESTRAGFWLMDDIVSQGTYDIEVSSGPIYIEADAILKDITANADSGPITICFNKAPTNLYLDSTNCGPVVERPEDWPAVYKVGNETPKVILSNTGKAVIEIKKEDQ